MRPLNPWEVQALSHSELLWEEKKYSYKNCFQDTSGMFLRFWVQIHLFSRIQPNPALWTPHLLLTTGSRGDVFVVRTSKPVENLRKNGLFWSRYSFVTHSIDRKPRDWGLARSAYSIKYGKSFLLLGTSCLGRPSGDVPCAGEDMACGHRFSKVDHRLQ